MSSNGGKKQGRAGLIGYMLAGIGALGLIIGAFGYIWSADQIAHWVAGAVRTMSSTTAWHLSLALALVGIALIGVSKGAASTLTKLAGSKAAQTVRGLGVLALSAAIALGIVANRNDARRSITAYVPPPKPEGSPPTLPGKSSPRLPKPTHAVPHAPASHHAPTLGTSHENVPEQSSPVATTASCSSCETYSPPTTPTATEASYSEPAANPEQSESSESNSENSSPTTDNDTYSISSESSASSESSSSASASSSVNVSGSSVNVSSNDSSVSVSSSGVSVATANASVNVSADGETAVSPG